METQQNRRYLDPEFADTYALARRWRNDSLQSGFSLFQSNAVVWKPEITTELERRITLAPDESKDTFVGRLVDQLDGASQEVHLLLAELLVVHFLATNNIGLRKKLELVDAVGAMAPEPFDVPEVMHPALRRGPINAGVGFLTNRFWIVLFMIRFAGRWSALNDEERDRLLDDPWAMKEFIADVPGERDQSQRNALLFLLFPETFEDITSDKHKQRIVEAHADVAGDDPDLDRRLFAARRALANRFGEGFSWYDAAIRPTWSHPEAKRRSAPAQSTDAVYMLRRLFDDENELQRFADAAAAAICAAHDVNPAGWTLNRRSDGAALTVGPNNVLTVRKRGIAIIGKGPAKELTARPVFVDATVWTFNAPPGAVLLTCDHHRIGEALDAVGDGFLQAVAGSATSKAAVRRFFSEDLVAAIEQLTSSELPRPDLAAVSSREQAWIVRMKRDGTREVVDAVARGDCRIFWSIDVPPGSSLTEIKRTFAEDNPDLSSNLLGNHAGQVHRFISMMQVSDYVLAPDGADLYIGEIASDARYGNGEWVRDVAWANSSEPVDRESVSPALYSRLRTLLTVTEISDLAGELALLANVADDPEDAPLEIASVVPRASLRQIDTDTARDLHLDRDWLQDIVELLERKRQLIFFGPPGTGKTYIAEKLAEHLVNEPSNYRIVQFHPSYSYEDFVEGFRPIVDPDGAMIYELRPGPLKQLADEARANPGDPYLLIVDEINRGNLAKIFGELYYLLEYREHSIVLQYGSGAEDGFNLPKNLFLIGTMNTADRSIALVDAAIRRRFGFVEFSPLEPPIGDMLRTWLHRKGRDDRPARLLDELNRRLDDRDLAVGPSYLMKPDSDDDAGLERIWRYEITPLLDEQFYGRREAVNRFTLDALLRAIVPASDESAERDAGAEPPDVAAETD